MKSSHFKLPFRLLHLEFVHDTSMVFIFTPVDARYVRIEVTGESEQHWFSIYEISLEGSEAVPEP